MKKPEQRNLALNKKLHLNYEVLDKYQAGIQLLGSEVKSCMAGDINISEAFAIIRNDEVWLMDAHITPYSHSLINHEPKRQRRLLLNKAEIRKLKSGLREKGTTLAISSVFYSLNRKIKLELVLVQGKKKADKRKTLMKKEIQKEINRYLS